MMKKLNCGKPKPTRMTLTLVDRFITYLYGVLEDVLIKVDGLLFPIDFVVHWRAHSLVIFHDLQIDFAN